MKVLEYPALRLRYAVVMFLLVYYIDRGVAGNVKVDE